MTIKRITEIPGPRSRELMAARHTHVARAPFHTTPVFVDRAHGVWITDVDGNQLLDFSAGIGVVNVGHTADLVVRAIQDQAEKAIHTSFNVVPYEGYVRLAEKINSHAPGAFAKKSFLVNSGAEAVENAIKIARTYTGRQAVVCFEHAFHGRTYMAMSLTSKVKPYRHGFAPFNPEVYRAPFPYAYRSPVEDVTGWAFGELLRLATHHIGTDELAAVIIEPVLGEGGYVDAPPAYMKRLREFCTEHGIVLIVDEIQTGFGRTGKMFACEHYGIDPDLMTLAKGLGGGMPIGAVTGRAEIMDAPVEGGLGGTYCGNPVACAAALAVFEQIEASGGAFMRRATEIGERLLARLLAWKARFPIIGDVRGLAPMLGIELVKDRATKEPDKDAAGRLVRYCYQNGLILMTAGTYGNVIRLIPPLVIGDDELDEGLGVIEQGFGSLGDHA
jgi:4-aminobutyrate aminotransferase/(S)-3-amino-2-methylpropionate transaminase